MFRLLPLALLIAAPALADAPQLRIPLDCTLGETCFIQQYVDTDPGPDAADFTGGPLAYDDHRGTDFRVTDLEALAKGVEILAPAAGTVRGIRDGMDDQIIADRTEVEGRECGNGVAIDHGDGWETQLCHLQSGSVLVAPGDEVEAGQPLGLMGLSGATQFPHVHISVRKDGVVVDPFPADLWFDPPRYEPGGLLTIGFWDAVPEYQAVKAGTADADDLTIDAPALVLWGYMFGGQVGDQVEITIIDPMGQEFLRHEEELTRTQAELFRAAGRPLRDPHWQPGTYEGIVVLRRDGTALDRLTTQIELR